MITQADHPHFTNEDSIASLGLEEYGENVYATNCDYTYKQFDVKNQSFPPPGGQVADSWYEELTEFENNGQELTGHSLRILIVLN